MIFCFDSGGCFDHVDRVEFISCLFFMLRVEDIKYRRFPGGLCCYEDDMVIASEFCNIIGLANTNLSLLDIEKNDFFVTSDEI